VKLLLKVADERLYLLWLAGVAIAVGVAVDKPTLALATAADAVAFTCFATFSTASRLLLIS
jgi:membrane protein implicated in regulation of membrane protease activity